MIREGLYEYIQGRDEVVPFKGKYAARSKTVFEDVEANFNVPSNWRYKPLRVEFELTTKCNDTCGHCGMGALSVADGKTMTDAHIERLVSEFVDVGLPSVAITGGEPFIAMRSMLRTMNAMRGKIDISKLTTNGYWGTSKGCARTFERLIDAGLMENRFFVPLMLLSIGEQTTPLENICRIIHHIVENFTPDQLQVGVSSLKTRGEQHKVPELKSLYQQMYGDFPEDYVHSTMRIYLENSRLEDQDALVPENRTSVSRWMKGCYACFAPTVGAYILPTALLKYDGTFYSCAAFNVPEKLGFGNVFEDSFRNILARINGDRYVNIVAEGDGLKALGSHIPKEVTDNSFEDSYCDSCTFLIDEFDERSGGTTGYLSPRRRRSLPLIVSSGQSKRS